VIVLDTNVVSELMRPAPHAAVLAWVDAQVADDLFLTSMTVAEVLFGVARLPSGTRRERLTQQLGRLVDEVFADRVLAFDTSAAVAYGRIAAARERAGMPIGAADAVIAATTASAGGASLATRNVGDFAGVGLTVVNPWSE